MSIFVFKVLMPHAAPLDVKFAIHDVAGAEVFETEHCVEPY